MGSATVEWNGGLQREAVEILAGDGGLVVSAAKVGYALMTSDREGLERKFTAKNRSRSKPGVVMCASFDQLCALAQVNSEITTFIERHWKEDVLLGCILPWSDTGRRHIPAGAEPLVADARRTSCFVLRYGTPAERIVQEIWDRHGKVVFASSANPSGQGNRGTVEGIGPRIREHADLVVAADDYVRSIQPGTDSRGRYAQGVMVSMVDSCGVLVPQQRGERGAEHRPAVIRKGLDIDRIMLSLADSFPSWDYRHGDYH